MHGISKDDLEGEDVRQHRRARRLWSVAVMALAFLTLVASLTGVVAVRNADRANAFAAEALNQQTRATQQEKNADLSAEEADRQLVNAQEHDARAKAAVQETQRQEKRAQQQRDLADRASADAARQQVNARRQQANARQHQKVAEQAAKRAKEQEGLARQQSALAAKSVQESRRQKEIAQNQERLAREAEEQAEQQKQLAELQKQLADEATAEARRQQDYAREQQRLADEAVAETRKQKGEAEQQQRIAIGRRLNNQAKAIAAAEPTTALMLGTAAVKLQDDDEARGQLTNLTTSMHYAGEMAEIMDVGYIADDVLLAQDPLYALKLWKVAERAKPTLLADLGTYHDWAISPDEGTVAAFVSGQSSVTLFDVTTPSRPTAAAEVPVTGAVQHLTFSQDGRTLLVGTSPWNGNNLADLWDVSDRRRPVKLATIFVGSQPVAGATFSPDGNTLVMMYRDYSTGVWDLSRRTEATLLTTLAAPLGGQQVRAMAFLRDAPILVAGGDRHTLLIDLSQPAEPKRGVEMANAGDIGVTSVVVSSDGRRLVTSDEAGRVSVFDLIGASPIEPRMIMAVRDPEGVYAIALSPDGRTVTTADQYSIATQWNVADHGAPRSRGDMTGRGEQGLAAAFTADGRSLLTVGSNPQAVVWDVTGSSAPVRRATPTVSDAAIYLAAVTPNGRILATADRDGRVRISDMADPAHPVTVAEFVEKGAWFGMEDELKISPDGNTVALGKKQRKADTVVLWDVTGGRAATRLGPLAGSRMPMAFSPDGRTFAIADTTSEAASLWTLGGPTGPIRLGELGALPRSPLQAIAFSSDGRTVAMGGPTATVLWDVSIQGKPRRSHKFTSPGLVSSIEFSPDRRTIVTLDRNRATVWDVGDHTGPVKMAAMPLVTQSTGGQRVTATFSPDGRALATVGASATDSTATLWDLTELAELRADPTVQTCVMAGRGLTEDEWVLYIPELPYRETCPG
jgi:WD40 repeat protein